MADQPRVVVKRKKKASQYRWLQVSAHLASWVPLAFIAWAYFTDTLSVNPIQAAEQRTGQAAIILLILSLACTPLYTFTRFAPLLNLRRPLGLYAFFYAAVHLVLFVGIDYGLDFNLIWADTASKRYIWVGLAAFLILLPLAITSIRWFVVHMGKRWKRLHRLVYAAGALAVLHFAWVVKGDVTRLQGDIARPVIAGVILALLLAARIPPVRKQLAALGQRAFGGQKTAGGRVTVRKKVDGENSISR